MSASAPTPPCVQKPNNKHVNHLCAPSATLYVVRHAETDMNADGFVRGYSDIPLNANGRAQVMKLRQMIHGVPFAICYSSDIVRVQETAEILTEESGVLILEDQRLRARNPGSWEGKPVKEYKKVPDEMKRDVETNWSLTGRVFACFDEIVSEHPGKNVLIVTHGGVSRIVLAEVFDLQQPPEGVTVEQQIEIDEDGAYIKLIKCGEDWVIEDMVGICVRPWKKR